MVTGPSPGPAPAAHARRSSSSGTLSSWRTWPQVKLRKNVPSVEGARTAWPSTAGCRRQPAAGRRRRCSHRRPTPSATNVMALCPTLARPGASPRSTCSSNSSRRPRCWASVAGSDQPGVGHRMLVIEGHLNPVQAVARCAHRKSAFRSGTWSVSQPPFSLAGRHFSRIRAPPDHQPRSVDPG